MVFSSATFLFLFLPLFFGIYYVVPFRWKSLVILLGSYMFYGWWRPDFLVLLIVFTFANYWVSLHLKRLNASRRKLVVSCFRPKMAAGI